MRLYYHPISYSQKALMAFHEKGVSFTPAIVQLFDPEARATYRRQVYPIGKVPFLVVEEEGLQMPESSVIATWIDERHPDRGPRLVPSDPARAREMRVMERFADEYLNEPMGKVLFDGLRPQDRRDPHGVAEARTLLDRAYAHLDQRLADGRTWVLGNELCLADCAAAPPLFYLQRVHPFTAHENVVAYAARLHERPSWQKILEEAAPHLEAFSER